MLGIVSLGGALNAQVAAACSDAAHIGLTEIVALIQQRIVSHFREGVAAAIAQVESGRVAALAVIPPCLSGEPELFGIKWDNSNAALLHETV